MRSVILSLLLVCDLCLPRTIGESPPQVITPSGPIEGYYKTSMSGRRFEAYEGIPYAQPPIGEFRFRVSKKISPWTSVLMAKQLSSICMQLTVGPTGDRASTNVTGSEDCLYLNVYTQVVKNSSQGVNKTKVNLLPVIFFIPGGGFLSGSAGEWGPKYLLDRNVTLVTINYRLGPLGFLSTEDKIVSGNMGLKDQVIALRWVNDNIRSFGGDPSKITIVGHSAGAASVHYHYLTNLTKGLFQRGMSLSGTALDPWALVRNPLKKAKVVATAVGCSTENIQSMIDCMRNQSAEQLVMAMTNFMVFPYIPINGWGPSVEKGGGKFTFIDRPPLDIIASGDVQDLPWIVGVVSEESLSSISICLAYEELFGQYDNAWETIAPFVFYYNETIPKADQPEVASLIKQHYLGESPISRETFNQTVRMTTEGLFFYGLETAAKSHARAIQSPVYVYYFSYRGSHSLSELLSGSSENFGVGHGDDVSYVLDLNIYSTSTAKDQKMQQVLITLWESFATNGTPDAGVGWSKLSRSYKDKFRYLHIAGPKKIGMKGSSNFGDNDFWRAIRCRGSIQCPS